MDTKELEKFNPTIAELVQMVEKTKGLTVQDLEDKAQLAIVRESRIDLKRARVKIEKMGKTLREDAVTFQKAVIAKEKELVAIIEPEEDRLAAIEKEAEELAIKKERLEKLPIRKERLLAIPYSQHLEMYSDEELLAMDANTFEATINSCTAMCFEIEQAEQRRIQQEADKKAADERAEAQKIIDQENAKKKAEQDAKDKELSDREAKVKEEQEKIDAEKKRIQDEKDREAELERVRKESEEKTRRDIAEEERIKNEQNEKEKAAIESKKKYVKFLADHGWTQENKGEFHVQTNQENKTVTLYREVGTFKF